MKSNGAETSNPCRARMRMTESKGERIYDCRNVRVCGDENEVGEECCFVTSMLANGNYDIERRYTQIACDILFLLFEFDGNL